MRNFHFEFSKIEIDFSLHVLTHDFFVGVALERHVSGQDHKQNHTQRKDIGLAAIG